MPKTQAEIRDLLSSDELFIETDLDKSETDKLISEMAPWRVLFQFSNGTRTDDFPLDDFVFNPRPLGKLRMFERELDLTQFAGGRVLDIGFNEGYHSIFFSKYLDCDVDSIDIYPNAVERVGKLSRAIGVSPNLMVDDASTYTKEGEYDLILHLGTLYHLPNVHEAIESAAKSLKPGGTLLLETTTYVGGAHEADCRYMSFVNRGQANFWALSKFAMADMFEQFDVEHVADVRDIEVKMVSDHGLMRSLQVYRRKA